jgi:hypothetical protein
LVHNAGVYLMRWFVLLASGLLLAWAAQNASLSASPVSDPEPYRVAAVLLWDATILSLTAGTCGFFVLSSRRREPRKMRLAWMAMVFYAIFGGALLATTIMNHLNHHGNHESTSRKIWTLTQYPLSMVVIAVGIAFFLLLRRRQYTI